MAHQSPIPPSKDPVARAFERLFFLVTGRPGSLSSFQRRFAVLVVLALVAVAIAFFWYDSVNHRGDYFWDELICLGVALYIASFLLLPGRAGRGKR
jgi:hypothetical protein